MRPEQTDSITATELARNISQTIDHVRINRTSILITRGNKVIAEISPPPKKGLPVAGLIELLKSLPPLSKQDSLKFAEDIQKIRTGAKLPADPWE